MDGRIRSIYHLTKYTFNEKYAKGIYTLTSYFLFPTPQYQSAPTLYSYVYLNYFHLHNEVEYNGVVNNNFSWALLPDRSK